ncbi:asparaginase [Amycolatopsis regifaucium]|uniref:Asparaginase n=1 Tax=Amycolatopsis regifaucium TaxID=546365 RepID=A0A154MLE8_9PSEU|nr:asparaginase [Amycolatopsis regifaucium]KZB85178.1 asparaginase [Amycolatopsis regifaucium]OKA04203.1 asparaginase [Amycolatopsis regifaucium]SFH91297.1 L-asparaginase II [Amycolatopsis regifaucium]
MTNPVLVEVVRSGFVESVHRGALVITAPDGSVRFFAGDVERPVYPRSSNKPLQAVGMLRAGLTIGDKELALGCGSHNGEPGHVEGALSMLARTGLTEDALACPPAFPLHEPSMLAVAAAGKRRAAMNCSGKHAAMLSTCAQLGWSTTDYVAANHPLQELIRATIADLTCEPIETVGVDGCGAPLFAFSLTGLARSFGRLVTAIGGPERRVADAVRAYPWQVAGTGREDTVLMRNVDGLLSKGGAEGVHSFALPDGTALALKIDDGAARARLPLLLATLRHLGIDPGDEAEALAHNVVLGGGKPVGELRVTAGLFG